MPETTLNAGLPPIDHDECEHCEARGDIDACKKLPCCYHTSWMVKHLNTELDEAEGRELELQQRITELSDILAKRDEQLSEMSL